jgi:protein-ribulosamine 3-kinase
MEDFAALAQEIGALTGVSCTDVPQRSIGGGSINRCYRWLTGSGPIFVKVGPATARTAFAAEADGLHELRAARAVRVPEVLATGAAGAAAFLALEWIERGTADDACEQRLGEGLAALHGVTEARFGWRRDNTIGHTPQANAWSADWVEFFRERRLRPQLSLAARQDSAGCWPGAVSGCSRRCRDSLPVIHRAPRSCMGICGAGTGWRALRGSRCSSTRRCTTATARPTSR